MSHPGPAYLRLGGCRSNVTFEEHSITGGLGGVVAETLMGEFVGTFVRIGINDRFGTLCGDDSFVMQSHGLAPELVERRIRAALDARSVSLDLS